MCIRSFLTAVYTLKNPLRTFQYMPSLYILHSIASIHVTVMISIKDSRCMTMVVNVSVINEPGQLL